jgi:hypothetical protein
VAFALLTFNKLNTRGGMYKPGLTAFRVQLSVASPRKSFGLMTFNKLNSRGGMYKSGLSGVRAGLPVLT